MGKTEIINELARKLGQPKKGIRAILEGFVDIVSGRLGRHERVIVPNFGTFDVKKIRSRNGSNPRTGERMLILGGPVPKFKPSQKLRERVRNGK